MTPPRVLMGFLKKISQLSPTVWPTIANIYENIQIYVYMIEELHCIDR